MSMSALALAWLHGPADPIDRLVLMYLADQAGDEFGNTAFGATALANHSAISAEETEKRIKKLIRGGWLEVVEHPYATHRVNIEWLEERSIKGAA